jgi:hypothetical protein
MATTIKLKNSVTTTNAPSSLVQGEVAINITDKKVWVGNAATTPIQLLGGGADGNFTNISVSSVATFGAGTVSAPSITTSGDTNTGIFFPAADTIAFTEGGVESMRIDSAGDVGIGSTNPTRKLQISQSIATTYTGDFDDAPNQLYIVNTNTTTNAYTGLQMDVGSNSQAAISAVRVGDGEVAMTFGTRVAGTRAERMRIDASGNVQVNGYSSNGSANSLRVGNVTDYQGRFYLDSSPELFYIENTSDYVSSGIAFKTNGSERMRITSGGDLLVGTTNSSLTAGQGFKAIYNSGTDPYVGAVMASTSNSQTSYHLYSTGAGTFRFYVGMGGTISATSATITTISDQRLKENIVDIDVGLDAVMALKPRKFDWKAGKGKDKKGDRGWIAQEFETVFPEMIDTWKDPAPEGEEPYKAVNADLIPVLVKAIQEQQQIINDLKARIETLESK